MANKDSKKKTTVKKTTKKELNEKKTIAENEIKNLVEEIVEPIDSEEVEKSEELEKELDGIKEEEVTFETVNGDPSVLIPSEKKEETKIENKPKRIGDPFNYSWNGQEIDY